MAPVSVDEHLAGILARIKPLAPYSQPLLEALGLPVAEDVRATRALPPFDNSAMDGYAVRSIDVAGASDASPVLLAVAAELHAGVAPTRAVEAGKAIRIMTGAPIPVGADAVVPFEDTDSNPVQVQVRAAAPVGQHIRRAGDDVAPGDVLVRAGQILAAREVGLLAGSGIEEVKVAPRPRVVVIATGEELVPPGQRLLAGQIHDSNSYLLTAAVRATGAIAYRLAVRSDEPTAFRQALDDQLVRADLVITTGGVSKGTRDVVKAALAGQGVAFGEVAMQPGKPQGFGFVGEERTPIFALPGNPVSAYVSFVLFVEPALRQLTGRTPQSRPLFKARITQAVASTKERRQYLRARFSTGPDGPQVTPLGGQGSHMLGDLAAANALIVLHEFQVDVDAGATVPVILLDRDY